MTYDQFVARQKARQQAGKPFGHFRQLTGKPPDGTWAGGYRQNGRQT